MNTSKSVQSVRFGENAKTPNDLTDHFQHKSIFNQFDLEVDHVKPFHFTESDKKQVINHFLQNEESLFFMYGLLFPQSVMNMQQNSLQLEDSL